MPAGRNCAARPEASRSAARHGATTCLSVADQRAPRLCDTGNHEICNFGLFGDQNGLVVYENETVDPVSPYHTSTSYNPDPTRVTGQQISDAVVSASLKCGPDYKLLHNNCQKFARLFMTALGASHSRELFHP